MAESRDGTTDSHDCTEVANPRKRRRDSGGPTPPPPIIYSINYPRTDLAGMIEPTIVPEEKFEAIQKVILGQHDLIHQCSTDIKDHNEQIAGLNTKLKGAVAKADLNQELLDQKAKEVVDLHQKLKELESRRSEETKATADRNQGLLESRADEIASLRSQLQKATRRTRQPEADRDQDLFKHRAGESASQRREIEYLRSQLEKAEDDRARLSRNSKAKLADAASELNDTRNKLRNAREELDETIRKLSGSQQKYDKMETEHSNLLHLGRKVLAQKTQENTVLTNKNNALRMVIGERDNTITDLYNQIARLGFASADEKGLIALETQAQRTLARMNHLETTNAALAGANESFTAEIEELRQKVAAADDAVSAATERASDAKAISEEQEKLIQKLLCGGSEGQ